jgi:hypothetical protein
MYALYAAIGGELMIALHEGGIDMYGLHADTGGEFI